MDFSIEDVARSTDDALVRRRFDQRNLVWWLVLLLFFALVSVIAIFDDRDRQDLPRFLCANASAVLVIVALFLLRDVHRAANETGKGMWRAARWVRQHVTAAILTYLALQYVVLLGLSTSKDGWVAWVMTFPFFMLAFRMLVSELVLLHVFLYAAAMAAAFFIGNPGKQLVQILAGGAATNAMALGLELFASRRLRREVITDWSGRRQQAREQIRMRDELRYARDLQLSMLPEHAPRLDWADIAGICIPATEVGGDYYDYFVDDDRLALVCGDVAGHGMASGLVLSAIRTGFTLLRDSLVNPAVVLRRLHDLVGETSRRRMLVTVSVVLLDRAKRQATISSAGHPPVVFRRGNGSIETIDLFAPPLGVRLPVDIPQRCISYAPGDVFVLHSDGIYETRNATGDEYGLDRLSAVIHEHAETSAESIRDAIIEDVVRFRDGMEQDDDMTIVVCRMT